MGDTLYLMRATEEVLLRGHPLLPRDLCQMSGFRASFESLNPRRPLLIYVASFISFSGALDEGHTCDPAHAVKPCSSYIPFKTYVGLPQSILLKRISGCN